MSGPYLTKPQKIGSPTLYSWGSKSIHWSYNIHTCFPMIATSDVEVIIVLNLICSNTILAELAEWSIKGKTRVSK